MKNELSRRNAYNDFDFFDEAMHDFFPAFYGGKNHGHKYMRTDIKETDDDYKLSIEMPGFKKDEIKVSLDNGYLTVSAEKAEKEEEGKEKSAKYLRRECRVSCQRSYYVGDDVQVDSVKAKYDNGMLELTVPKAAPKKIETKSIAIE